MTRNKSFYASFATLCAWLAILVFAAAPGCGGGGGSNGETDVEWECAKIDDCALGKTCINHKCVIIPGDEEEAASCVTIDDCPVGMDCINKKCVKPDLDGDETDKIEQNSDPESCRINEECPEGFMCLGFKCVDVRPEEEIITEYPEEEIDDSADNPPIEYDYEFYEPDKDDIEIDDAPPPFCGAGYPCPSGSYCLNNTQCVQTKSCNTYSDCDPPNTTCVAGLCRAGCAKVLCGQGADCDTTTGLCKNSCPGGCQQGECCNNGTCGPCCQPSCPVGSYCTSEISSCTTCPCCKKHEDCRHDDSICTTGERCDFNTGSCQKICPASCPVGQTCSSITGYVCAGRSPQDCDIMTTCQIPCYTCSATMFNPTGYCIPDAAQVNVAPQCQAQCFGDGVVIASAQASLCCAGLTACADSKGAYYCCSAGKCDAGGKGCLTNPGWSSSDGDTDNNHCDYELVYDFPESIATLNFEGETVFSSANSTAGAYIANRSDASGGKVACLDGVSGDHIDFVANIPTSGKYIIKGVFMVGGKYGKIRLTIDGRSLTPGDFDAYQAGSEAVAPPTTLGQMTLGAGDRKFNVRVISKNVSSSGYKVCVDKWTLEQIP